MTQEKKGSKFIELLIILLVIYIVGYSLYRILLLPINNIYIVNNNYLTDQEIIDISHLSDYPSFAFTTKHKIKNNLLKNEQIKNVKIKKDFGRKITIEIEEAIPLFTYNDKTILDTGKMIESSYTLPIIINDIDNTTLLKLINKYKNVNEEIRPMISEIKYDPDDLDDERFLFTMNDGNAIYITLYKIASLNEYIKIQGTLEGKKGILYLDSGNYFEIVE